MLLALATSQKVLSFLNMQETNYTFNYQDEKKRKGKNRIGSTKHIESPPRTPENTIKKLVVTISMIVLFFYFFVKTKLLLYFYLPWEYSHFKYQRGKPKDLFIIYLIKNYHKQFSLQSSNPNNLQKENYRWKIVPYLMNDKETLKSSLISFVFLVQVQSHDSWTNLMDVCK